MPVAARNRPKPADCPADVAPLLGEYRDSCGTRYQVDWLPALACLRFTRLSVHAFPRSPQHYAFRYEVEEFRRQLAWGTFARPVPQPDPFPLPPAS